MKEIQTHLLDLVMRDNDYVIFHGDIPLLTPAGHELSHSNPRVLKQIILELSLDYAARLSAFSAYSLLSFQIDNISQGTDPFLAQFEELSNQDPFIQLKTGSKKQSQLFDTSRVQWVIEKHPALLNVLFMGVSGLVDALNRFISVSDPSGIKDLIRNRYSSMNAAEKTMINVLSSQHHAGIMMPMLFVSRQINASEYVNGLFALSMSEGEKDPYMLFIEYLRSSQNALDYLVTFSENKPGSIPELIGAGESSDLEFKSTLRWDIKAAKTNQQVERAVLKTISAFLNSGGGILLIGVRDDGSVEGIESDRFLNEDKFLLHLWTLIRTAFGRDVSPYVKTSLEKIDDKSVCKVRCLRSSRPVFLRQPGFEEEFFIRLGPSSVALAVSEALKYIADHFTEK